jgi:hypothetical protein
LAGGSTTYTRTPDMIVRLGNKNKEGCCSLLQVRVSPHHQAFPPANLKN